MKSKFLISCSFAALAAHVTPAIAQTEIQWWHSMTAVNNEWVNDLAKDYNASQKQYKVTPVFKGSYDESMAAAIAAFRAGSGPDILQVFEVGTATMMASKGAIVPVGKVMKDAGAKFDPNAYVPAGRRLLHRAERRDAELPVQQLDDGVLHQPRRVQGRRHRHDEAARHLARGGVAAAKLKASGHKCPFTPAWQGWTQLESFSAWHNVEFATKGNGLQGLDARMKINSPLHVRHIENLANMAKQGLLVYKGRGSIPQASFTPASAP
jgi:sn-glycerol 3-phosphate transport system substrate-binding protein